MRPLPAVVRRGAGGKGAPRVGARVDRWRQLAAPPHTPQGPRVRRTGQSPAARRADPAEPLRPFRRASGGRGSVQRAARVARIGRHRGVEDRRAGAPPRASCRRSGGAARRGAARATRSRRGTRATSRPAAARASRPTRGSAGLRHRVKSRITEDDSTIAAAGAQALHRYQATHEQQPGAPRAARGISQSTSTEALPVLARALWLV